MSEKKTTPSKQVADIAKYIRKNHDKEMSEIVSYYVAKCRKSRRQVERYYRQAEEYNKTRNSQQEKPKEKTTIAKGRPSAYNKDYNEQVFKLCLLGATDKEIADFFNIAESTLNYWKTDYPEFLESIKRGKSEADANVGASLYSRAIGHRKKDCEKVFMYRGEVVRAEVTEYFPPDVTAQIFWLKNRQPDKWRDKQIQEIEADSFLSFLMKTNTVEQ